MPGVDREVMDTSISKLELDVLTRGKSGLSTDITKVISEGSLEQSMIGASDMKLTLLDRDYRLLQSGVFQTRVRARLDSVAFRLVEVSLTDVERLELTFEHWLISEMREHSKPLHAKRATMTRAQFILWMLKELLGGFTFICPDLDRRQLVAAPTGEELASQIESREEVAKSKESTAKSGRAPAVSHHNLTVKGRPMSSAQSVIISEALNVAAGLAAPKLAAEALVVALIQENDVSNRNPGNPEDRGALSLIDSTIAGITKADGHGHIDPYDVGEVSGHFLTAGYRGKGSGGGASALARAHPHFTPAQIGSMVQGPAVGYPETWNAEAKAIVEDYEGGGAGFLSTSSKSSKASTTETAQYEFSRGLPGEPEDTYTCSMRLAEQVEWRFFVVGRPGANPAVYFIDDDRLIRSKPRYLISPTATGVGKLTFDVELGQRLVTVRGRKVPKPSEAQLEVRTDRWEAPPGTVIQLADYGLADGRWLIDSIQHDMFSAAATVNLRAPQKALPEPRAVASVAKGNPASSLGGSVSEAADTAVKVAVSQIGVPYRWGGEERGKGFDCSGLVQYAYGQAHVSLPRVAQEQYDATKRVAANAVSVGDLVFFGTSTSNVSHVGIVVGRGEMIDAPHTGAFVRREKFPPAIGSAWGSDTVIGYGRV